MTRFRAPQKNYCEFEGELPLTLVSRELISDMVKTQFAIGSAPMSIGFVVSDVDAAWKRAVNARCTNTARTREETVRSGECACADARGFRGRAVYGLEVMRGCHTAFAFPGPMTSLTLVTNIVGVNGFCRWLYCDSIMPRCMRAQPV